MKKNLLLILNTLLLSALAACSATTTPSANTGAANAANGTASAPSGTPGPGNFEMSTLTRLLLGTFELEDTDQAVTAEQAQALVPLWQAVLALSQSDTAATSEMQALESQIQGTFTAAQLDAINAMNITTENMQALMTELGVSLRPGFGGTPPPGGGGFEGGGGPPPGGGGGGFGGGGGPPPGGGGGFGGGPGGGGFNPQDLSPEQQATLEARRAGGGGTFGAGVSAPLVTALIELLQAKTG